MNDDKRKISNKFGVYRVTGDTGDNSRLLGYARSNPELVRKYFSLSDFNFYSIHLDEITILNITPELVDEKQKLLAEKIGLEKRLKEISEGLEKKTGDAKRTEQKAYLAQKEYFSAPRTVTEMAWPMS